MFNIYMVLSIFIIWSTSGALDKDKMNSGSAQLFLVSSQNISTAPLILPCYLIHHKFEIDISFVLTLSWQRSLSYRNQSIDLLSKSIDWFLYHKDIRHEIVRPTVLRVGNVAIRAPFTLSYLKCYYGFSRAGQFST